MEIIFWFATVLPFLGTVFFFVPLLLFLDVFAFCCLIHFSCLIRVFVFFLFFVVSSSLRGFSFFCVSCVWVYAVSKGDLNGFIVGFAFSCRANMRQNFFL